MAGEIFAEMQAEGCRHRASFEMSMAHFLIRQVLARELRGWGAAQCGRYAAVAGAATAPGP